ncbi:hypothetical protein C8R46DRAFT_1295925 [Mycena filopes]|nr:hypothetical protein C8R46DRAFT_1295925 [Mycena filopes]
MVHQRLERFLEWNPPRLLPHPDAEELCPPLTLPVRAFYGRHIAQNLQLKRVTTMSSLVADIAQTASEEISKLAARGALLPSGNPAVPSDRRLAKIELLDATSVSDAYAQTSGCCMAIASTVVLSASETSPEWLTVMHWCGYGGSRVPPGRHVALDEQFGPVIGDGPNRPFKIDAESWKLLDEDSRSTVHRLFQNFPVLAVWEVFRNSAATDELIRDLGLTTSVEHGIYHTSGFQPSEFIPKPSLDAITTPWNTHHDAEHGIVLATSTGNGPTATTPRRSTRLRGDDQRKSAPSEAQERAKSTRIIPASQTPLSPLPGDALTPAATIGHAWSRAVEQDATIIVFHNGSSERIGVRDRKNQTLYLSDLIDVTNCKAPAYGRIHTGLFMIILRDALDRLAQHEKSTPEASLSTATSGESSKRPLDADLEDATHGVGAGKAKRRKVSAASSHREPENAHEVLVREMSTRSFALLQFQYKCYNSPAPASLLRIRPCVAYATEPSSAFRPPKLKKAYAIHECISLTVVSEINTGATSIVHAAILKLELKNGETLSMDVVVKIAILPFQREKMKHEYAVYLHLGPSNIKGLPEVYGLFDDVQGTATVMVMSACGQSLWKLWISDKWSTGISPVRRSQFISTLEQIHRAGVRHRDLQPSNLMFTDSGEPIIIDFDCAKLDQSGKPDKKAAEMELFLALFDGAYPEREESKATMSHETESSRRTRGSEESSEEGASDSGSETE